MNITPEEAQAALNDIQDASTKARNIVRIHQRRLVEAEKPLHAIQREFPFGSAWQGDLAQRHVVLQLTDELLVDLDTFGARALTVDPRRAFEARLRGERDAAEIVSVPNMQSDDEGFEKDKNHDILCNYLYFHLPL